MKKRRPFKDWERDFIRLAYPLFGSVPIANVLRRTSGTIRGFAVSNKIKFGQVSIVPGEKFGKLTVICRVKAKKSRIRVRGRRWRCKCECGNFVLAETNSLTSGHSSSCGCGRIDAITKNVGVIPGWFQSRLKINSKKRDLEPDVDLHYLDDLIRKQKFKCALSGLPIAFVLNNVRTNKQLCTASLDRIDSGKGYVKGNVQFLHLDINYLKNTLPDKYFIALCQMVAKNNDPVSIKDAINAHPDKFDNKGCHKRKRRAS